MVLYSLMSMKLSEFFRLKVEKLWRISFLRVPKVQGEYPKLSGKRTGHIYIHVKWSLFLELSFYQKAIFYFKENICKTF